MSKEPGSILIAGAGCAGLSLAMHLIERKNFNRKIVVVEPRTRDEYTDDRTWSGFSTKPHLFSGLASTRWHRWKCKTPNGENISESRRYSYESIRSSDYYNFCFEQLTSDPRVEIHFGCRLVNSVDGSFDVVDKSTGPKRHLKPDHFFDSRPQNDSYFSGNPDDVVLWQQFSGIEVETVQDTFEPGVATLMDFAVSHGDAIRFIYVLPFSRRRALVEFTVFHPSTVPFRNLRNEAEMYLKKVYGESSWRAVGYENGRIPMVTSEIASNTSQNTTRIGISGGLARPSTGYAFASIHEHSRQIAMSLESGISIKDRKQSRLSKVLDRIFLSYLAKNPEKASHLFLRISQRTDPDRFARFMMDTSSLLDKLAVIMSMPKLPFIVEAWHARNIWLRRRSTSSRVQSFRLAEKAHS
ncbi:MAG: lycopene cyclase family protein [bacterium]|nr:lycopene cyclase family protein [bacterium]